MNSHHSVSNHYQILLVMIIRITDIHYQNHNNQHHQAIKQSIPVTCIPCKTAACRDLRGIRAACASIGIFSGKCFSGYRLCFSGKCLLVIWFSTILYILYNQPNFQGCLHVYTYSFWLGLCMLFVAGFLAFPRAFLVVVLW